MEEEKNLQALCHEAKDALGMTSQDLADASGVPLSTVNNTFAARSRDPSVYTMGSMCAATGTSIDEFFGIRPKATPQEIAAEAERRHAAELRCAHLEGEVAKLRAVNRLSHRYSLAMFLLAAAVIVFLPCGLLFFDASVPAHGVVLYGKATAGAWALIGFVVAVVASMAVMLLRIVRRGGDSDEPMPTLPVRQELMR